MALPVGTHLGPYEILAPIGAGGMGEVYRARDTRLQREVAVKLLRAEGGGNLQRLEIEARTIAALDHPNLVAIHDVGSHAGAPFLVMELIAGKSLRDVLAHGALAPRRAIEYARQMAQGLAAAHAAGVVHRDLKPGNIMITPEGRVKILDFGLAKTAVTAAAGFSDAETLAVSALAAPATQPGTVLGTAGYMAPEQVRGEAAGPAADIFAFGAILYEMLSGQRAFPAPTSVEAMAAILNRDPPDLTAAPGAAAMPPALERIVRRCLEKSQPQRFQSSADLDFALSALAEASSTSLRQAVAIPSRGRPRWRTPAIAALTAAVAVALCLLFALDRATATIPITQLHAFALNADRAGALWSPDGKALAFAAAPAPGEPDQIFLYLPGGGQTEQLTHEPASVAPSGWSGNGQDVVFIEDQFTAPKVFAVSAAGGTPRLLDNLGHPKGGVLWSAYHGDTLAVVAAQPDGKIGVAYSSPVGVPLHWYSPAPFAVSGLGDFPSLAISPDGAKLLLELPASAGTDETWLLPFPPRAGVPPRRVLPNLPPHDWSPKFSWTPDSRHVLITCTLQSGVGNLWEADPTSGAMHLVAANVPNGYRARLAPHGGMLAIMRFASGLTIVSVNVRTAAITKWFDPRHSDDQPAWAGDASALAFLDYRYGESEIWLRQQSPQGAGERELVSPADMSALGFFQTPALSPHARRVAFSFSPTVQGSAIQTTRIYLTAVAGGAPIPLTTASADTQQAPVWSPDGTYIAYLSGAGARYRLMVAPSGVNAQPKVLKAAVGISALFDEVGPAWSRNGKWIAFEATDGLAHIIAPDGSDERVACHTPLLTWTFSANSQSLYGIAAHGATVNLVEVPLATGVARVIGSLGDMYPASVLDPGWRLTLAPDGGSVTCSAGYDIHELDLVAPFSLAGGAAARLRRWLHLP
ncbi:MAG: protein kinase domain-containing protein [Terriglobales bacterium]